MTAFLIFLTTLAFWVVCEVSRFFGWIKRPVFPVFLPGAEGEFYLLWWSWRWVFRNGSWRRY